MSEKRTLLICRNIHKSGKTAGAMPDCSGWIIYALVYAGFAFVNSPWQAWALFLIYGVYFGLTEGVEKALVADLVPPEKRGTAFGFYNLAFSITVFPASLLFGGIWSIFDRFWVGYGASAAFLISAAISVCAALLLLTVQTKKEDMLHLE